MYQFTEKERQLLMIGVKIAVDRMERLLAINDQETIHLADVLVEAVQADIEAGKQLLSKLEGEFYEKMPAL